MKTYKFLIISLVLIGGIRLQAQQFPMHYMYDQYKYTINPAGIKIGEGVGVNASYSNHWNDNLFNNSYVGFGIDGGFFQNGMGLGLVFSQDIQSILRTSNIQLSYAYRVQLKSDHFLTFGISAGVSYQGQKTENIITGDYSDPLIGESHTGFLTGFGINYQWKGLEIDAVIPSYNTINKEHFPLFLSLGYDFNLSKEWHLKPAIMYSLMTPEADMVDIRLKFAYKEWIWLQLGYRTTNELLVLLGGSYKDVSLGIGGGFNLSGYGDVNKGNLEIVLAYRFKNAVTKKSRSQFEIETQESISQLSDDVSTLIANNERQKHELKDIKNSIETLNKEIKEEYKGSVNEIKEAVLSIKKEELELEVNETKILDKQYFVVVYSTKTPDDAEKIVNRMAKQNVKGQILKDSHRSYYYIYTNNFDNLDNALEASQKERERGFSGAWVLIVR